jgi:hypothetical protein
MYDIQEISSSSTIEDAVESSIEADVEPDTRENDFEEFMDHIDRRIKASERRELLRAALEAPFWWSDLPRALKVEVVRSHLDMISGQVENIQEAFDHPLDHDFWTEEVPFGPEVSTHR